MNVYLLRIKKIIEKNNLSETAFAKRIGVNQVTLNNMFQRNSTPKSNMLHSVCIAFGVNPVWLLTGKGSMYLPEEEQKPPDEDDFPEDIEQGMAMLDSMLAMLIKKGVIEEKDIPPPLAGVKRVNYADRMNDETRTMLQRELERARKKEAKIKVEKARIEAELKRYSDEVSEPEEEYGPHIALPLYESVAAGKPLEIFDAGESFSVFLSRLQGHPDEYFAVRVRGSSMTEAGIPDDAIVVMRKEQGLINGKIYLFRHEGEYTLKRYYLGKDGKPRLAYDDGSGREVEMREGEGWEVVGLFCFVG